MPVPAGADTPAWPAEAPTLVTSENTFTAMPHTCAAYAVCLLNINENTEVLSPEFGFLPL